MFNSSRRRLVGLFALLVPLLVGVLLTDVTAPSVAHAALPACTTVVAYTPYVSGGRIYFPGRASCQSGFDGREALMLYRQNGPSWSWVQTAYYDFTTYVNTQYPSVSYYYGCYHTVNVTRSRSGSYETKTSTSPTACFGTSGP